MHIYISLANEPGNSQYPREEYHETTVTKSTECKIWLTQITADTTINQINH